FRPHGSHPWPRTVSSAKRRHALSFRGRRRGAPPKARGAERVGFEPTRRFDPPTRFPVAHLKPLGHLSGRHDDSAGIAALNAAVMRAPGPREGSRAPRPSPPRRTQILELTG